MARAAHLERHDQFEGVGAHELNPRYHHEPGRDDGWDPDVRPAGPLLAARSLLQSFVAVTASPVRLDGVDVSHWQHDRGVIDWTIVAGATNGWAACKLTQSTRYRDPSAPINRAGMRAAGIRQRGVYHWLSSTTDPAQQARWFLAQGPLDDEFAMCDAEESGVTVGKVVAWCEQVEAVTGRPCVVYTGAFVDGGHIWQSLNVRNSIYGPRPMILAAYTSEARALALPGVAANPWHAWQFTSSASVPGIVGRVDGNRIDDRPSFDRACGIVDHSDFQEDIVAQDPVRMCDTRPAPYRIGPVGRLTARRDTIIDLDLGDDAVQAALNVTVVDPSGPGWLVVWSGNGARPDPAITVIWNRAGDEVANHTTVPVSQGTVTVYSLVDTDLTIEVVGVTRTVGV